MIKVSENVKDREKGLSPYEDIDFASNEFDQEDELSEPKVAVPKREGEPGEDSLSLYLAEVGQTPLLSPEEATVLAPV